MSTNKKIHTHLLQTLLGNAGTNDKNSATIDQRLYEGLEKMTAQLVKANRASLEVNQRLPYINGKLGNTDQSLQTRDALNSSIKVALERNNLFSNKNKPFNPEQGKQPKLGR
jgi:hypothetical protein